MYRLGQSFPRQLAGYKYPKKKRRYAPNTHSTIYTVSVTDNVTVSQTIAVNQWVYRTVVQAVTASQTISEPGTIHQSVTDNVSVSQTISAVKWVYRSVVSAVTASQTLAETRAYYKTLVDSVTASQTVSFTRHHISIYNISVAHDVTVADSIRLNKTKHFAVSHSITVGQLFQQSNNVIHNVAVSQVIAFTRVLRRSIAHNVVVTSSPFITSPRALSLFHNVAVTDQFDVRLATFRFSLSDNVTVADTVFGRLGTYHVSVTDTVHVADVTRVIGAVYAKTLSHTVTASQKVNLQYRKSIVHDVNVFHTYSKQRFVTRTLTTALDQTSSFGRDITFSLSTDLILSSSFTRQVVYNRTLVESETVSSVWTTALFIPNPGPHPVVSGINYVYGYLTLLESIYGTIVLPVPELNDSIKHNDSINLKRSMSGNLSAYVKKSTTQILSYTWLLDYPKALELKQWALTNFSERVTLTNWKGEIWVGKIISDDLTLKAETKYQGNPRQKTSVTIEFEGIKING